MRALIRMAVLALVGLAMPAIPEDFSWMTSPWWTGEYEALLRKLEKAPGRALKTSYAVRDNDRVHLDLRQLDDRGIRLIVDGPGKAQLKPDTTGTLRRGSGRSVTYLTDVDRDGRCDLYSFGPSKEEQFSPPNRVESPDDQAAVALWNVGIGYSINWFLHGVAQAGPRAAPTR
jgi:hypothetical protein